jgi:hypothetical protein
MSEICLRTATQRLEDERVEDIVGAGRSRFKDLNVNRYIAAVVRTPRA